MGHIGMIGGKSLTEEERLRFSIESLLTFISISYNDDMLLAAIEETDALKESLIKLQELKGKK